MQNIIRNIFNDLLNMFIEYDIFMYILAVNTRTVLACWLLCHHRAVRERERESACVRI